MSNKNYKQQMRSAPIFFGNSQNSLRWFLVCWLTLGLIILVACQTRQTKELLPGPVHEDLVPGTPTEAENATATSQNTPIPAPTDEPPDPVDSSTEPPATASSRIEVQNTATPSERQPLPVVSSDPLRIAVIGDYGQSGRQEEDVAALVQSWDPALILTTGDNNYPDGEAATIDENIGQYYGTYIFPYAGDFDPGNSAVNRFFPVPGNHDWNAVELQPYLDYFTLPGNERYYDFSWDLIHFFAIDSDSREPDGVSAGSTQAIWLRDALAASNAPWNLVFMHHPPYSSGYHGSVEWMRWPFAEWGATAVIAGHDHLYERLLVDDFPYFVNGLSGHPSRYPFLLPLPGSQVRFNDEHGAMLIEATAQELRFQFIAIDGTVVDTFILQK